MNKRKLVFWSLVIALGGLLFGIDTAVISGAEQSIQRLWNLNVFEHGLTVSIALIGTVFGAIFGGLPTDLLGRKKALFWIALLYLVSSIGSAVAVDWYSFLFFRFIGGLGVGASSVTAPMYISEISPSSHRGRLVALFQVNIVIGILLAFLSNYLLRDAGEFAWRWMLGVEAIPALAFLILVLYLPESPRWLIMKKGNIEEARRIFQIINPSTAKQEVDSIKASLTNSDNNQQVNLFQKKYYFPIALAVLFATFNQVSGINAIIYYAPRIFEMTGLGTSTALLSSVGLGAMNLIFTVLASGFIDKYGRKRLMLIGSFGLIATLGLVSVSFYTEQYALVPVYLFAYIGFFAFSQGAVIWVFISEIFPNEVRGKGQSLGSSTHWLMASLIAFAFPYIASQLGGGTSFLIFAIMMLLQLIFVWKMMPETKGRSLEDMEKKTPKTRLKEDLVAQA